MLEKDYSVWTVLKCGINAIAKRLFFYEREIWYCHLGENIGYEQDGRGESFLRPMVIVRKFNNELFWGVPLTRTYKDLPFYFRFRMQVELGEKAQGTVTLSFFVVPLPRDRVGPKPFVVQVYTTVPYRQCHEVRKKLSTAGVLLFDEMGMLSFYP